MRMRVIAWATPLIFSVAAAVYLLTVLRAPANASFGWLVATAAILGFLVLAMERMLNAVVRGDSGRGGEEQLTALAAPDSKRAARRREIEREKLLTLRSLKELEFDHGMGKVSDADFSQMATALRERAMRLIGELDQVQVQTQVQTQRLMRSQTQAQTPTQAHAQTQAAAQTRACPGCSTLNDEDAQFCKRCGSRF